MLNEEVFPEILGPESAKKTDCDDIKSLSKVS